MAVPKAQNAQSLGQLGSDGPTRLCAFVFFGELEGKMGCSATDTRENTDEGGPTSKNSS